MDTIILRFDMVFQASIVILSVARLEECMKSYVTTKAYYNVVKTTGLNGIVARLDQPVSLGFQPN